MKRRFLVEPPLLHIQKPFGSDMYPLYRLSSKGGTYHSARRALLFVLLFCIFVSCLCMFNLD